VPSGAWPAQRLPAVPLQLDLLETPDVPVAVLLEGDLDGLVADGELVGRARCQALEPVHVLGRHVGLAAHVQGARGAGGTGQDGGWQGFAGHLGQVRGDAERGGVLPAHLEAAAVLADRLRERAGVDDVASLARPRGCRTTPLPSQTPIHLHSCRTNTTETPLLPSPEIWLHRVPIRIAPHALLARSASWQFARDPMKEA
jgi:hypothetical protein